MRICSYCVMPNHWHFVLWPQHDGDLAAFMQRLTVTHVTRWQKNRRRVGEGHVYQGRFKSFPVETDDYFYQLVRYVERNALRANLVPRAEEWRWSSLWRREHGSPAEQTLLAEWPMPCPRHWLRYVNEAETESELEALRRSVHRGQPFGSGDWVEETVKQLNLASTIRPRGRPRRIERSLYRSRVMRTIQSLPVRKGPVPFVFAQKVNLMHISKWFVAIVTVWVMSICIYLMLTQVLLGSLNPREQPEWAKALGNYFHASSVLGLISVLAWLLSALIAYLAGPIAILVAIVISVRRKAR